MPERLIITNGDSAVARLREAGIEAEFLPWRDALHDGPVPGGLLLEALSIVRAQFLAKEFGLPLTDVIRQFANRDALARNHGQYERVELWFEHDLYDQLQLIELLNFFAEEQRAEALFLVQADDHLATQSADSLHTLAETAHPVDPVQVEAAKRCWAAFTASTPEKLAALSLADLPALPHLAPALRRLLHELPAVTSGLSLTEERALSALAQDPQTVSELFAATQAQETARFLGDAPFFRRLDGLAFAAHPLIAGLEFRSVREAGSTATADRARFAAMPVRITETGRDALAGRFDHAVENTIDRWLGGTHVTTKNMWRRDETGRLAVAPGA